jgi:hypothetical protein
MSFVLLFLALKKDFAFTNDADVLFKKVGAGAGFKKAYPDTDFDERTLLCMVLPIRFQNCKVTNLTSVSYACARFLSFLHFLVLTLYIFLQIMSTYKVYKHFRTVLEDLEDCHDLTKESFPNLFVKGKNVTNMKLKWQRLIILFLVRLHYSVHVHNTSSKSADEPAKEFNFATFPQLVDCLNELEGGPVASGSQSKTKVEDASNMIENCRKKLKLAQSHANKLNLQLGEIDGILAKIPKPKKKKTESPVLVDQKMLMKMLTQFSAKKKRKLSHTDGSESEEDEDDEEDADN